MAKEWFRIAKDVDRLKPSALKPAKDGFSPLSFGIRKDPGSGRKKKDAPKR